MRFTPTEKSIFAALLVASLWGFWMGFGRVIRTIRTAKPDADFKLRPIATRIRDFVWEVLLQAKVIRQRPWPGLAHAFVFWGLCAFALVTLNHFANGFGLLFLPQLGVFRQFYFSFAAVFAIRAEHQIHREIVEGRHREHPKLKGKLRICSLQAPQVIGRGDTQQEIRICRRMGLWKKDGRAP